MRNPAWDCNLTLCIYWRDNMNKVAIVGTGQTVTRTKRKDVNLPELMREAVNRALESADLEFKDIDAICVGNSPEMFDGVNHPEKWVADSIGGRNLPVIRTHTGGTVGASTGIFGWYAVSSGMFDTVLVVSGNKLTETSVQKGLSYVYSPIYGREYAAGAPSAVANQARMYMHLYPEVTERHFAMIGVKARKNAMNNPYATLKLPNVTVDMLMNLPYLSTPLRQLDSCPTSDGACAMVLQTREKAKDRNRPKSWIQAVSAISDGTNYPDRNWAYPIALEKAALTAYKQVGITNPLEQLDVIEMYDAFTVQELIWSDGLQLCERGKSYQLLEEGITSMGGKLPINPSGGVLSNNSIGATAMIRQAEIALQMMEQAGDRQVEGARVGLAHGWGGFIQFHTVMIQSKEEELSF
ncbi:MAG: thiolase domain-containing protein [Candidatus Hydrogenedentota bacterium]|nr:MAG: thiolase domain-containing protein [Candidatus Hydrogenedentota bacterium]